MQEVEIKLARVRKLLDEQNLQAVLLKKQANFSWLTAGGYNMVGVASEMGVTSVLVTAKKHYVIANRIEAARMMDEEDLGQLGFELLTHEWYEDKEGAFVKEVVGEGKVGCDAGGASYTNIDGQVKVLRYELTEAEVERYLFLGTKLSTAIEKVLAGIKPGDTEAEITGRLAAEVWPDRIDPTGYMAAADDRARLYRHPIPTMNKVQNYIMLCLNARYKGLITTITRFAHFGPVPADLKRQYADNVEIECAMIANTKVGQPMNIPFLKALDLYESKGYKEEWKLHHQGGSMGYYARDVKVTESTTDIVLANQAFCWNPSISGTKSEDGFIATEKGPVMISKPITFPTLTLQVDGIEFVRPAILEL